MDTQKETLPIQVQAKQLARDGMNFASWSEILIQPSDVPMDRDGKIFK